MSGEEQHLVEVDQVRKSFRMRGSDGRLRRYEVLHGISLAMRRGETVGVVGESGCGKSTLARVVSGLERADSGEVRINGRPVRRPGGASQSVQMVFQDPYGAFDPQRTILQNVMEPMRGRSQDAAVAMLERVGVPAELFGRNSRQLSGGQLQRACIARAMVGGSPLVIHDESLSSLDVSLQARVMRLMRSLQEEVGTAYLFISHDLAAVREVSHRVVVMYLGRVVEIADAASIGGDLFHPYSVALRSAVPRPDPVAERSRERIVLSGDPPSPTTAITGCVFSPRCPIAQERCRVQEPALRPLPTGGAVACHFPGRLDGADIRHALDGVLT